MKLKVVHYVCFDKKFIPKQIEFLNRHFGDELDQEFFVHGAPEAYFVNKPANVIPLNKQTGLKFIWATFLAERVIFNGLFRRKIVLIFSVLPWVLHKAVWLPWGADLYWRLFHCKSFRARLFDWIKGQFIKRLYAIATPTLGDYDTAKSWYGGTAKYIDAGCNIFSFEQADLDQLTKRRNNHEVVRIQVGNSADPTNEHLEALELLSRFVDNNIQVFVPLTYGNQSYAEQVINRGRTLFGEKFIPLTQFMSPDEYNKHLASLDVLILNHRRQQGFGNIVISLYLGVKVYLHRGVSIWSYLSNGMGCVVHDTGVIGEISYKQFTENSLLDIQRNRTAAAHLFDRAWQKASWTKLYFD